MLHTVWKGRRRCGVVQCYASLLTVEKEQGSGFRALLPAREIAGIAEGGRRKRKKPKWAAAAPRSDTQAVNMSLSKLKKRRVDLENCLFNTEWTNNMRALKLTKARWCVSCQTDVAKEYHLWRHFITTHAKMPTIPRVQICARKRLKSSLKTRIKQGVTSLGLAQSRREQLQLLSVCVCTWCMLEGADAHHALVIYFYFEMWTFEMLPQNWSIFLIVLLF